MRTRIRRGLAAALAVSALSLTAACGGEAKDDAGKDGADKPAATAPTTAAPTSEAPATALTAAQMKAAALELKDLPSGWKTTKRSLAGGYKADKPECQELVGMFGGDVAGATKGADVDFTVGNNDSEISETVLTFAGTGAADYVKKFATAIDGCSTFTATSDGTKQKITVTKRTAPQGAEEAHAVTLGIEVAPGMVIEPNVVVARQGTGVARFLYLSDPATTKKDFDALARTATEKFAKAARG
ncbi:hypothetical protein [Streptomyces roseicoloratus]|uniref:Lipoprotein n=1 Tax=Streptomyces roseicoloratus TaxID=2508722 RepID=A0ABY9RY93_9ACTN|nr:hypothetical protein [Streptomyces roseicoloratus]WMX47154.1 hypothetical protein RGF97_23295 [Streptomyces roseicoloratus]